MSLLCMVSILVSTLRFGPLSTSGYIQLDVRGTSQNGEIQELTTLTLAPQFTIFGMPLSINLILNNEKEKIRQRMNRYLFKFRPDRLIPKMPGIPSFILSFRNVSFGSTYPDFSELTLYSTRIKGIYVTYEPGPIYLSFSNGTVASDTMGYERILKGIKFGFGSPYRSHLHFTYLHSRDMGVESDTLPPMENFVVGTDFALRVKSLSVGAEVAASELTMDVWAPSLEKEGIPDWAIRLFNPRVSSHFDFAFKGEAQVSTNRINLKLSGKMIGPGFKSFGATLRNDLLKYEFSLGTHFLRNRVSVNFGFQSERDNLLNTKEFTTTLQSQHFDMGLFAPGLPFLSFNVDRYEQGGSKYDLVTLGFSSGYPYNLEGISMLTRISMNYQRSDQPDTANKNSQSFYTVIAGQSFIFSSFNITVSGGYAQYTFSTGVTRQTSADMGLSYLGRNISPNMGVSYTSREGDVQWELYGGLIANLPYGFRLNGKMTRYSETRFLLVLKRSW